MSAPELSSDIVAAWQAALATEHEAVFGYPLVGAELSGGQRELALSCESAHQSLRELTMSRLVAAGHPPVAPRGDYPQLYPGRGAAPARSLAIRLETRCAAAWRFLYAVASDGDQSAATRTLRRDAQAALQGAAVRATQWRRAAGSVSATVAFPGI